MAELKTKPTDQSVVAFLNSIPDEQKRQDAFTILELMRRATRAEPQMWGSSIVGLGHHHYQYESGREGEWFLIGFSPRKQNLTLYLTYGFAQAEDLLKRLGKYSTGKSCLYLKKLADIDLPTLQELIEKSVEQQTKTNG
jgi:hypothetical protein